MMKIEHVAIWTENLELMKDFYTRYFNGHANELYRNEKNGFSSYFISFDGGARLELMQMDAIPANKNNYETQYRGIIHFSFSLGSKDAVNILTDTLRAAGFAVASEPRTTGDGYYESCVLDPENNRIELVS